MLKKKAPKKKVVKKVKKKPVDLQTEVEINPPKKPSTKLVVENMATGKRKIVDINPPKKKPVKIYLVKGITGISHTFSDKDAALKFVKQVNDGCGEERIRIEE